MTRILKRNQLPETLPRWLPRGSESHEAARELATADAAAASRVTESDLAALEQSARQQGLESGITAAEASYRERSAKVEELSASLQADRREFFDRIEPELVRLSVSIAEKVIGSELELRPEVVVDLVRSAMKRLRDREHLRVSVNPQDAERVKEARADLIAAVDGVRKLEVVEDRRVDVGGCVIESGNGTLDARIRTQIDEIGRVLGEMLPNGQGNSLPASVAPPDSGGEVRDHPGPESISEGGSSD